MASRYAPRSPIDELLHMAEAIDKVPFRSLSVGIGLGATRPVFKVRAESIDYAATVSVSLPAATGQSYAEAEERVLRQLPSPDTAIPAASVKQPSKSFSRRLPPLFPKIAWQRFAIAHLADLVVVGMSLLVAFAVASVFFAPFRTMARPAAFLQWEPVKFVLEMSAWQTVAALYGIFAMYWLVFRIVVGNTLGQNWSESVFSARRKTQA